jgi:GT2 family glycosyltransferase
MSRLKLLSASEPNLANKNFAPAADANRQVDLLRAEVRRLSTQLEQRAAELTDASIRQQRLEAAFAVAMEEREKILASKAWRTTRAVQQAMRIPRHALSPIMTLARRLHGRRKSPTKEPTPPPSNEVEPSAAAEYERWVSAYDTLSQEDRNLIVSQLGRLAHRPVISIIIRDDGADGTLVQQTVASIRNQLYPAWEVCLGNDSDVSGAFIAFVEPGDLLPEHALYEIAMELHAYPDAALIYTDEDRIDALGRRYDPSFKPDFSIELQLGNHLTGCLTVYHGSLFEEIGLSPRDIGHGQKRALAVQAALRRGPTQIRHIHAVLYHRLVSDNGPDYAVDAHHAEANAELATTVREMATVQIEPMPGHREWNSVTWPLPNLLPRVSVIIPTRDRADLLARCVLGLLYRTDYPNLEILIIDNDSVDTGTHSLFQMLQKDPRVRVVSIPGTFNFSALNNAGVRETTGDILVMLNNDVDVIGSGWLKEMVSHAVRPDVGAVGAKLIYGDGRIQHAGVVLGVGEHNAGPGVAGHFGHSAEAGDPGYLGQFALTRELSAVTGACLALRRDVFEAVGGLNEEQLHVSFNDVDLCLRIRAQGFRIIWTPFAELYHLESASRGLAETPEQIARAAREADYMRDRWGPVLDNDPFYNANFDRKNHEFALAHPPYRKKPWLRSALTVEQTAEHNP